MSRVIGPARAAAVSALVTLSLLAAGCQKAGQPEQAAGTQGQTGQMPPMAGGGGPMMGGGMADAEGPLDGNPVALKLNGQNSAEELNRALAELDDPNLKTTFDTAYRYTFSAKQAQRRYEDALRLCQEVVKERPNFAPAYRVMGYDYFNTGQSSQSLDSYKKAVEIDPNYGEGHYALAFMYAMGDRAEGLIHYKKAMELGVTDERDLGGRFYPEAAQK